MNLPISSNDNGQSRSSQMSTGDVLCVVATIGLAALAFVTQLQMAMGWNLLAVATAALAGGLLFARRKTVRLDFARAMQLTAVIAFMLTVLASRGAFDGIAGMAAGVLLVAGLSLASLLFNHVTLNRNPI